MELQVLGAGFGRTSTASLAAALELLGYGRVYHMYEVGKNPELTAYPVAAQRGENVDWSTLFAGLQHFSRCLHCRLTESVER